MKLGRGLVFGRVGFASAPGPINWTPKCELDAFSSLARCSVDKAQRASSEAIAKPRLKASHFTTVPFLATSSVVSLTATPYISLRLSRYLATPQKQSKKAPNWEDRPRSTLAQEQRFGQKAEWSQPDTTPVLEAKAQRYLPSLSPTHLIAISYGLPPSIATQHLLTSLVPSLLEI